jgi:hypothetical protein
VTVNRLAKSQLFVPNKQVATPDAQSPKTDIDKFDLPDINLDQSKPGYKPTWEQEGIRTLDCRGFF